MKHINANALNLSEKCCWAGCIEKFPVVLRGFLLLLGSSGRKISVEASRDPGSCSVLSVSAPSSLYLPKQGHSEARGRKFQLRLLSERRFTGT